MTLLQHHILALSFTAVTTSCLGMLVFLADPKRRLNQVFGLYSLTISWWSFFEASYVNAPSRELALFLVRLGWIGIIFIAPTFLHTVFLFTGYRTKTARLILISGYGISSILCMLHLGFNMISYPLRPLQYLPYFPALTLVGLLVPLTFLVLVNLALWKLRVSYQRATDQQRIQLRFLFWASLAGYLGGSGDWLLTVGAYVPGLNPFGIYTVPMYSIATTYAVLHHRLFDVHIVIRKSLVYSLLVTVLTVSYFGFVHLIENLFLQSALGYHSTWLSLVAFALMALLFQPLKIGIQRIVDLLLFRAPKEELVRRVERLEQETRQTEKLKAIATLAAGMAHEIKNPLTSLKTFTEYLPHKYDDPDFREKFTRIVTQEVEKINALVQNLLEFAKPTPPKKQPVHLSRLLDETVELLHGKLVSKHIQIVRTYADRDEVCADPAQIKQALLNILLNSLEAMERPGSIRVTTVSANGHLDAIVADTGQGIEEKDLPHIFDPFYTTKADGTGLGLSVVHGIVKEHGGSVMVDSKPNYGTTIRIRLPHHGGGQ